MQLAKLLRWSSEAPASPQVMTERPSSPAITPATTPAAPPSPSPPTPSTPSSSASPPKTPAPKPVDDSPSLQRRIQERVRLFEEAIKAPTLNLKYIRSLAFEGVPETHNLRPFYWKILLGYLPLDRSTWPKHLASQRQMYHDWVQELIVDPHEKPAGQPAGTQDITEADHPLSTAHTSAWNTYFKDQELLFEIDKDVKRTFPHLHFFQGPVDGRTTKHSEAIKRVLFIYAKLNKGIRYVQGMNEILAPIYYVFAMDGTDQEKQYAEEDAFFCFKNLMGEIMNNFIKTLDQSEVGIGALMKQLDTFLNVKDKELWENLNEKKLVPQFYSFRWLTLLLSQEFQLPDVIRLWDSFFADAQRFEFMIYFCCAMIILLRDELLAGDFADNLKLLQNYPASIEFLTLLKKAKELRGYK